jgi:hypothetical protein
MIHPRGLRNQIFTIRTVVPYFALLESVITMVYVAL